MSVKGNSPRAYSFLCAQVEKVKRKGNKLPPTRVADACDHRLGTLLRRYLPFALIVVMHHHFGQARSFATINQKRHNIEDTQSVLPLFALAARRSPLPPPSTIKELARSEKGS